MVEQDKFKIVGPGYHIHEPKKKKHGFLYRIKGSPILSLIILILIVLSCVFAGLVANHDPSQFYYQALNQAPNNEFYFGTDSLGRDLFSIMFYGGRASLSIGLLGAAIIAIFGTIYGCISGTANEKIDNIMMRFTELCGSIPALLMVLILSALFPRKNVLTMSIVIGITSWFGMARIVRSEVRQIRNCEYVLYSRCTGGRFLYVMRRHLIPNFLSAVMFVVISNISSCITMESTLSFLGLGLPIDTLSWGSMLSLANKALITKTWWVIIVPGLFLVITLMCITNVGNYLRKENTRKPSNL